MNFKTPHKKLQIDIPNMLVFTSSDLCTVLLLFSTIMPRAVPLSFNFTSFNPNGGDVKIDGKTIISDGLVQLTTKRGAETEVDQNGRAVYPQLLPLWDKASGQISNFTTHFSFIVNSQKSYPHGDGFAFFLSHQDLPLPVPKGGGMGLGLLSANQVLNSTFYPSTYPFVAVEFDAFPNKIIDPTGEHVGIDVNSMNSSASVRWCSNATAGPENEAWIRYDSASKNLSVSFFGFCNNTNNNTKVRQFVSHEVDLSTILPERVMFGFSASTGSYFEIHTIKSWSFSSSLAMGQSPDSDVPKGKNIGKGLVAGLIGVGGVSVLVLGLGLIWCILIKKKKKEEGDFDLVMDDEFERGTGPRKFSYDELARATNDFAEEEKLGEGGFGGVYRGFLKDPESYIAVKRVSKGSKQGVKEYASEVRIVSRLRHKNLVQLIGWCHERRGLLLVYELMPNGSLDSHLFKEQSKLSWVQRYKIVQGLASALFYLHEEWEQCVLHRDVKSSNIMLDSSFTAKLGDFGLARLVDHAKGWQTTLLAGTLGYMAPESYAMGKASKESDVYSFGVVALEIACGRKPFNPNAEESQRVLVRWVWELYGSEDLVEATDPKLGGDFDEQEMKKLMTIGIWCAHPDHGLRPSMRQVIQALDGEVPLPVLPSKMPVPTYSCIPEPLLDASSGTLTISTMAPR